SRYGGPQHSLRPSGNSGWNAGGFRFEKEAFFVLARKSRGCAEAYMGTPHKRDRRLTPPGRKRTLSGWKLDSKADTLTPVRNCNQAVEFAANTAQIQRI